MAHVVALNSSNIVVQTFYIGDQYVTDENGNQTDAKATEALSLPPGVETEFVRFLLTSYNTRGNVHMKGGTPLRKNYAGIGYTYDSERDAFIPPKPLASFILDEETCYWIPPVPKPGEDTETQRYIWDENTLSWILETRNIDNG